MPLDDDDGDDGDSDSGCWSDLLPLAPVTVSTTIHVHLQDSPSAAVLAPFEHVPLPSPSQQPHAILPASHPSQTPAILASTLGIVMAFAGLVFLVRCVGRRSDLLQDAPQSRFGACRFRRRSTMFRKRLSDESWVSPMLPSLGSPVSPLSHDLELSRYAFPCRKLVPGTTLVCTPTDTDFGSHTQFASVESKSYASSVGPVPPVRAPSPVYISPFSLSPSLSSSSSSLSPAPSTEWLENQARLSRLLSSTFRAVDSPTRPTTARLIQMARAYAHAYRPSNATPVSLYASPASYAHLSGTSIYTGQTARDTVSTVTTTESDSDTVCTVPHLRRAAAKESPFANLNPATSGERSVKTVGTSLGLQVRLSDASEHARYRSRERERERARRRERERLSAVSSGSAVERQVFKLRDSEGVLRVIGW